MFSIKNCGGMSITNRLNPKPYTNIEKGAIILKNLNKRRFEILKDSSLCICGSGKPKKSCHNSIIEESLVYLLWEKYLAFDKEVERQVEENHVQLYCKTSKCNKCCSDYFYISAIEYFTIKNDILETKGIEFFNKIVEKSSEMLKELKREYPEEFTKLDSSKTISNEIFQDKEYVKTFIQCPLLNEDGLCDRYSARPLMCRFFGTSYLYTICDDIIEHTKNIEYNNMNIYSKVLNKIESKFIKSKTNISKKEIEKIMVEIAYNESYKMNVDMLVINEGNYILQRPYPLFYFFANDKLFEKNYILATKNTVSEYILNQIKI